MADNSDPERPRRGPGRPFQPGESGNPGGKPKKLREIEAMLDAEHRTVEQIRETFRVLREVAHGVNEPVFYKGVICGEKRVYSSAHMEIYLNRVLGPVKELKIDLTDAPDEVVRFLAERVN